MTAWLAGAAQRQPEALALVQGSKRLDYAELAGLASRRAAMLRCFTIVACEPTTGSCSKRR